MMVKKGRLALSLPLEALLAHCERLPMLRFVPVDHRVAVAATELEPLHADPADRIIVATARSLAATLVTKDERLHAFEGVRCAW
jgi:PIN domain nuclease of toxin-antitoxin system